MARSSDGWFRHLRARLRGRHPFWTSDAKFDARFAVYTTNPGALTTWLTEARRKALTALGELLDVRVGSRVVAARGAVRLHDLETVIARTVSLAGLGSPAP